MAILYVVATPIGNLSDLSPRASEVLSEVDLIAAEDTRRTKKLTDHLGLGKTIISYHQHSGKLKEDALVEALQSGQKVALVTDAGTPGVNDPGGKLVERARQEITDLQVVPIPGPSALITALSISGFPADQFTFLGYFPRKKGRETLVKNMASQPGTYIFYEAPHRIEKTIALLAEKLPAETELLLARELTKQHEQIVRGSLADILTQIQSQKIPARGEFVIIIHNSK